MSSQGLAPLEMRLEIWTKQRKGLTFAINNFHGMLFFCANVFSFCQFFHDFTKFPRSGNAASGALGRK